MWQVPYVCTFLWMLQSPLKLKMFTLREFEVRRVLLRAPPRARSGRSAAPVGGLRGPNAGRHAG